MMRGPRAGARHITGAPCWHRPPRPRRLHCRHPPRVTPPPRPRVTWALDGGPEPEGPQSRGAGHLITRGTPVATPAPASLAALGRRLRRLVAVLLPHTRGAHTGGYGHDGLTLAALGGVVLARTALSDRIASLNGASVRHVLRQDRAAFLRLVALSVAQSAASAVAAPTLSYLTAHLALSWRSRLTEHLHGAYLTRAAFYGVVQRCGVDDPDARLTADAEKLTSDLANLAPLVVKPVVDLAWFGARMHALTAGPGLASLYAYMAASAAVLRSVAPDHASLAAEEARLEAGLRSAHGRLRSCAESVAFFGGGDIERAKLDARLESWASHARTAQAARWAVGAAEDFFTRQLPNCMTWALSLLYAQAARGDVTTPDGQGALAHDLRFLASVVSHTSSAFGDVLALPGRVAELAGGVARVAQLSEALAEDAARSGAAIPAEEGGMHGAGGAIPQIAFESADVTTPTGQLLARGLNFRVVPPTVGRAATGDGLATVRGNLLVTGPNGAGKSSLFRVLGGLWPLVGGGRVRAPPPTARGARQQSIFYVPQRPYSAIGTLRDQLTYPLTAAEACAAAGVATAVPGAPSASELAALDGATLAPLLASVRLGYLLERVGGWGATAEWADVLSLGEQQRLGMARLFYHKPAFGVLDQCTDATSVDVEEELYATAASLGITLITISQRPALVAFHSAELRLLDGRGAWTLHAIEHDAATAPRRAAHQGKRHWDTAGRRNSHEVHGEH